MTRLPNHELRPLFSWRSAITHSDLRSTVRHVALTLSLHMNEAGGSCFPSLATLGRESGLGEGAVRNALHELRESGYLHVEEHYRKDGGQTSNTYEATTPDAGGVSAREEGGFTEVEGGPFTEVTPIESDRLRATERATGTSRASTDMVSTPPMDAFDVFWDAYPRKVGKPKARSAWKANAREAAQIMVGLARWADYWRRRNEPEFVPHPSTWLNQRRWEDDPPPLTKRSRGVMQDTADRIKVPLAESDSTLAKARRAALADVKGIGR